MKIRALVSKLSASLGLVALVGTTTASAADAATYTIDHVHSAVIFRIQHMKTGFTYGRFDEFSGTIVYDAAKPEASSVQVEIKVDSVDTNAKARDEHLKSPTFFNAGQFPTITFQSTAVKKNGDTAFDITGDLTIHGVKKSVSVKMEKTGAGKDMKGKDLIGFEGTLTLLRSDYEMKEFQGGVADEVRLTLAFEGIKQ